MAEDASFAVASGGSRARAEALRESLQDELKLARREAEAAAAARLRAQEEAARLEQELAAARREEAALSSKARPLSRILPSSEGTINSTWSIASSTALSDHAQ